MKFTYACGDRPLEGFTIKRGIGVGGFGEVYYAVTDAGKEVALKLVQRSLDVELRGVSQCLNLKHPHLVALYDVKQSDDGQTWVVMEYVAGESLEQVLDRNPDGLGQEQALSWLQGIGQAVDHLHDRGIVHRDLKPANLFVEDGLVKVGDYGLAKFVSASRRSGHTESVGTVHYMAPEVANGRYGKELDVYAAGIIFYEMLTGRVPFDGQSVGEILMKHLTAEPDLRALDEPYRRVVARALAKDPARRYPGLGALVSDLEAAGVKFAGRDTTAPSSARRRPENGRPAGDPATQAWSPDGAAGAFASSRGVFDDVWTAFFREDPVMRLIRRTWQIVWPKLESSPVLLVLATIVGTLLVISGALPFAAFCVLLYIAIALPVRWLSRIWWSPRPPAPSEAAPPKPPAIEGVPPVGAIDHAPGPPAAAALHAARRERWHAKATVRPVEKSARRKVKEAVSSLLLATVSASLLAIGVGTILGFEKSEEIVLLGLVGTAGSWAVLAPSKWWEGTTGDAVMRRFVLGGLGAGVGAFAGVAAHEMFVTLPNTPALFIDLNREVGWHTPAPHLYSPAGQPFTGAHAVYYASLFLVLRWWRLADPYRKKRFRFASLAGVAFWAWLVSEFWEYPDPWAVACGVLIAAVVQLASPWHPEEMAPVEAREVAV